MLVPVAGAFGISDTPFGELMFLYSNGSFENPLFLQRLGGKKKVCDKYHDTITIVTKTKFSNGNSDKLQLNFPSLSDC